MSRFAVIQKVATSSERKKQRSASSQRHVFQLACFQMRLPYPLIANEVKQSDVRYNLFVVAFYLSYELLRNWS
jgi:hypothetical protein